MNPIRGLVALPTDCSDLGEIEWTDTPVAAALTWPQSVQATEVLPEPIKFKSLIETLGDLITQVRGHKAVIT